MIENKQLGNNWEPIEPGVTEQSLRDRLISSGVAVELWGQGSAKTVKHLMKEIAEGESKVSFNSDGSAVERHVGVVWVDVFHADDIGNIYELRETRQVYADGRVRERALDASLGEKMKPDEDPTVAAMRALQEELTIREPDTLHFIGSAITKHTPDSYPGLASRYTSHKFVATLGKQAFQPDGYVEIQPDKTNYYEWTRIG